MANNLYYQTVTPLLRITLTILMSSKVFNPFRLVGGTALSLQRGHRCSDDVDLFTDAPYGSIDFSLIHSFLESSFPYLDPGDYKDENIGFGKSYFIGESDKNSVKLDLFYTDGFIQDIILVDDFRLAPVEEIIAMKIDVVQRGGRKKDFWDLHELKDDFSFEQMLALHEKRYPHNHDKELIKANFKNFDMADQDFNPVCLRGKHWEIIKLDMTDFSE